MTGFVYWFGMLAYLVFSELASLLDSTVGQITAIATVFTAMFIYCVLLCIFVKRSNKINGKDYLRR